MKMCNTHWTRRTWFPQQIRTNVTLRIGFGGSLIYFGEIFFCCSASYWFLNWKRRRRGGGGRSNEDTAEVFNMFVRVKWCYPEGGIRRDLKKAWEGVSDNGPLPDCSRSTNKKNSPSVHLFFVSPPPPWGIGYHTINLVFTGAPPIIIRYAIDD
jgi:hypothetical protein